MWFILAKRGIITTGGEQARFLIANAYDNNRRFDFNSNDAMFDRGDDWGDEMRTTVTTASYASGLRRLWNPPFLVATMPRVTRGPGKAARQEGST